MIKIKTLDQLAFEIYGIGAFRSLNLDKQILIVKIQSNNIKQALLELKSNKRENV